MIDYAGNRFGICGINELVEWGRNAEGEYVVLEKAVSSMIENGMICDTDPRKYYTDTSFRVAVDSN